ncbi:uncharacterized protein F4812DRAFT_406853 [Daldinia caldariorum]|uniref:uncharacterized protein n=1 Tax=Daldinia caldariorum TaxID=326644 RepID=UPI002008E40B|nr:uncharacterized protein F4812DRAFT_406853 [Daldinia caldariorum]KAI1467722.1 hypothetical protein F4812DRAFT_406853 [Daldinia caldariorum]
MHLTYPLTFLFVACSAATPQKPMTFPDASEAPFSPPTIKSVSFSGSGCPQSGSSKQVSGGWQHFTFTLPDFAASYGGSKPTSVNCQAHMSLTGGEPGWQVALRDVWTQGHVELEPDVKLTQYITAYYSQDAANTISTAQTLTSPSNSSLARDITTHSGIPKESAVWSPCSGPSGNVGILNVNFRVAFTSPNSHSYGYFGGGKNSTVREKWGWSWRRC